MYGNGHRGHHANRHQGGIGCLAWIGLVGLVGFAVFFSLCVACTALAVAGGSVPGGPEGNAPEVDPDQDPGPVPGPPAESSKRNEANKANAVCAAGSSPTERPWGAKIGKAGTLSGRVCAVEIFVSGAGASWTAQSRTEELARAARGYALLRKQASRYGQEVDFIEVVEPGELHIEEVRVDARTGWVHVPVQTLQTKLGRSLDAMLDGGRMLHGCKNGHVVLHVTPEATVSHAECGAGAEHAVVAHRDGVVLAHEVLHLYGAWDFYHLEGSTYSPQSAPRAADLERMFPGDIMGFGPRVPTHPEVGALTAWLVGWSRCAMPSYASYDPAR